MLKRYERALVGLGTFHSTCQNQGFQNSHRTAKYVGHISLSTSDIFHLFRKLVKYYKTKHGEISFFKLNEKSICIKQTVCKVFDRFKHGRKYFSSHKCL